nr:MAG TPA: hypothetical protein [Bacteriophage sp.]
MDKIEYSCAILRFRCAKIVYLHNRKMITIWQQ